MSTTVPLMEESQPEPVGMGKWPGLAFAALWMLYLVQPLNDAIGRHNLRGYLGIAALGLFAIAYLTVLAMRRGPLGPVPGTPERYPLLAGLGAVMVALTAAVSWGAGQTGLACVPYIAVAGVVSLPVRWGWAVGVAVATAGFSTTFFVPGWHVDGGIIFGGCVATLAIWGIKRAIRTRTDNIRLQLDEQRNRFARDLHDILGHSLTVITVKAELAGKLIEVDPDRARTEIASLEQLARDALSDVRRAVAGYREITLPGELANARAALEAAQIRADLPNSTDDVEGELRELFAWTVREGVTNVIRHSGASDCVVRLDERSVEVRDNGRGGAETPSGSGLRGLRERAAAHNATVVTESLTPGFSLRLVVP